MSALNDANTQAAVANAKERVRLLLDRFSHPGVSWEDFPSMSGEWLQHLAIDLSMLGAAVDQRIQETYQSHEPIELAAEENE